MEKMDTCLWFDGRAEEAATFYKSVFTGATLGRTLRWGKNGHGPEGSVLTTEITLLGHTFVLMNGGPQFTFNEAASFMVKCDTQEELDHYWNGLIAGGGKPVQCGWLKDKFGVSWQVFPAKMTEWLTDPDQAKAERVMAQMMEMVKLDFAPLIAAHNG